MRGRRLPRWAWALLGVLVFAAAGVAVLAWKVPSIGHLIVGGDDHELREGPSAPVPEGAPSALILALDGVDRDLLYTMLREGELPLLEALLGGREGGELPHAHLDETLLAPLPTSTLPSWATMFTGEIPAVHGVSGNEYFIREERRYAGPAPVSVSEPELVLRTYTEGYADALLAVETVYERLRRRDDRFSAWVSMSQFHRGADRLLLADRSVVADAFGALLQGAGADQLELYASLDREVIETLTNALEADPPPRLLTVYLGGIDLYAHGASAGPDAARRRYLREVIDGVAGELTRMLEARDALEDRYVLVLSDHGHTEVVHDARHALGIEEEDDPPAVVAAAGYRLRPFEAEVDDEHDFDTVVAYGGAMAYVYVADRSSCPESGARCEWSRPPRFEEDVVPLAEAFFAASERGEGVPAMRGTIDLVLVRREEGEPLEVYLGGGRTEAIGPHLERHPRERYVAFESRMRDLSVGPKGHHAGDIILIARNGDETRAEDRYYFAGRYHSWHGSPSRQDSEVPLIVAHRERSSAELRARVRSATGESVDATEIVEILEALLYP